MFLLVSILVFAADWKGDFSLFKMVLDWHSLLSFFCCKSQETISLSSFSHSSLCSCRNKKYHFLCQKLKKQKCLGKTFFRSMMKADLEWTAATQPYRLSPERGWVFFPPLKHNVHEQHVGYRPCCVADGFYCLLKVAKWYKTSLFFIAANFSQSRTGCSQSHQNLCKHGRLTFPLTDGPWGIAVELPVSFHIFRHSQDACKKVFKFGLCMCMRVMLRSLWWQICM